MSIDPLSKSCDDAGPPDAQATWASDGDAQTITFGDGNVWGLLRTPTQWQKGARLAHPVLEALGLITAFD